MHIDQRLKFHPITHPGFFPSSYDISHTWHQEHQADAIPGSMSSSICISSEKDDIHKLKFSTHYLKQIIEETRLNINLPGILLVNVDYQKS